MMQLNDNHIFALDHRMFRIIFVKSAGPFTDALQDRHDRDAF